MTKRCNNNTVIIIFNRGCCPAVNYILTGSVSFYRRYLGSGSIERSTRGDPVILRPESVNPLLIRA